MADMRSTVSSPSSSHGVQRVWSRSTLAVWLALALVAGSTWPSGPVSAQSTVPLKERFAKADKNRDGKIDREEFHQAAVESFYFRDKGRKGFLLVEELREASPEAFKAANRKGDGRLSLEEYVNALFIDFDKADVNKDGSLTFEEIEVYSRGPAR
jgi:Ca2+-binding EF-hand superfamily protein